MILQVPLPGGPELVILLLVLLMSAVFLAVPVLIAVLVYRWWREPDVEEAEIERLRARVAELEAQLANERADEDDR
ncbi:hypothetical protein [Halolamina salifodinae]|uniref:Preprotein translocase subunit TatA n=1 Tax=Halolamina salifodinae TaxID=1202767 RepID=A0A8T4GZI7_9EURY|nr:hypothetical protein [Halolamina salifodinae]MBP1988386.1 hypothetical protein [Halolamina salifodinae]